MGGSKGLLLLLLLAFGVSFAPINASEGDADPLYITCVDECEKNGSFKDGSVEQCRVSSDDFPGNNPWYKQEPLYLQWKDWNCKTECRYHCMMQRETERESVGLAPVKYHGKWLYKRAFVFQEPLAAALAALTLLVQFHGWLSFFLLLHYKLPLRPDNNKTYYEFTGLWHIYGLLSMNAWFWSAIYHTRDTVWIEKIYYSSAVALLGYSLILAILRAFNLKDEAARVMVAAPLLAFLTTHILYLNFYELDYGLNLKVCMAVSIAQLLLWVTWTVITKHPSSFKVWVVAIGGAIAGILEIYDFPPHMGYVDAHALCLLIAIPLSYLWWSFAKEDAEMRTSAIIKKAR